MSALDKQDFASVTWLRFKEYCDARLAELRVGNDKTLSPEETAKLRGKIAEVKRFLALDVEHPVPEQGADDAG